MGTSLDDTLWDDCERLIRRFESAWRSPDAPDLAAYLPGDSPFRSRLLIELVHVDLECRARTGESVRVEPYLDRFPSLSEPSVLLDLIAAEYRLRRQRSQPPEPDEYRRRFPQLGDELDQALRSSWAGNVATRPFASQGQPTGVPTIPGYVIGTKLGSGGMGVVYQAEQPALNRTVAIKTLQTIPSRAAAERFFREAETVARLDHPNIVPVYEVGSWSAGDLWVPYFVMKWYPGGSLDSAACGPGSDYRTHARNIETVAAAIHHAHERGVLHRDLKPSNILVSASGDPCVADFGLAGWYDPDNPRPMTAAVVGTPSYMAPEQAESPADVTTAVDVYGLGAILYHQLTGRPPFEAATALATLRQVSEQAPEPLATVNPEVPRDLAIICAKCLRKDPSRRYRSARELANDLERWRTGEPISARPTTTLERIGRLLRRQPVASALAVLTLAVLIALYAVQLVGASRVRAQKAETSAALAREQQLLYLERVSAAGRLYDQNQVEQAWHALDLCPPALRGWEWRYLDALRRANDHRVLPHEWAVVGVTFLADGRVATADVLKNVRLWNSDGTSTLLPVKGPVVRAHPTANILVVKHGTTVHSLTASVWDLDRHELRLTIPARGWLDFSPDGAILASADKESVKIWDVKTWTVTAELKGLSDVVNAGVFSKSGRTLYVSALDRSLSAWDMPTATMRAKVIREQLVVDLELSADEKTLVEISSGNIAFTDPTTLEPRRPAEAATMRSILLPTVMDSLFATALPTGEVVLRRLESKDPLRSYRGHVGAVRCAALSPDKRHLITGGEDGTARVWDLASTREYREFTTPAKVPQSLSLSRDGRLIGVAIPDHSSNNDDVLRLIDASTGDEYFSTRGFGPPLFDPQNRWTAIKRRNGRIEVRDAASPAKVLTELTVEPAGALKGAVRPDGHELGVVSEKGKLHFWDCDTWKPTTVIEPSDGGVIAYCWSAGGTRLAVCYGREIEVRDAKSKEVIARISPPQYSTALCLSPDGRLLAVAAYGRYVRIYDADKGEPIRPLIGNPTQVIDLAFSPEGTRLATAGMDGRVRLWDVETGTELLTLNGSGEQHGIAWSPDGTRLYGSGFTVRCWDAGR